MGKGSKVTRTVDLMSNIGAVVLMHRDDPDVVKHDVEFLRHMETINGFFTFQKSCNENNDDDHDRDETIKIKNGRSAQGENNISSTMKEIGVVVSDDSLCHELLTVY